ncbi:MAG: hypothetical protein IKW13_04830 [Thermoguttaceae bacterium]|nr:hypothetical protein [Thermoguttaceae bacterium]
MKALYSLILASGTKEALFAALWLALDEEPGTFADVDFASLRTTAARFGVALSESQIRKRVKELEKLDVLTVVPRRERGRFDLLVYQPAPSKVASEPKPEPTTPLFDAAFGKGVESFVGDGDAPDPRYRANSASAPVGRDALAQLRADAASVVDAVSETETETVAQSIAEPTAPVAADHFRGFTKMIQTPTVAEIRDVRATSTIPAVASVAPESREPVAAPLEEINNNKYIKNKTINKPAKALEAKTQAGPEARSVADVRSLVDFEAPRVAAFRRVVVGDVWERTVHPDLIDRLVALAVLRVGGTTASTIKAMIHDAKAEVALWKRTDGRRGQPQIWRALTPEVKRVFENAGWVWAPTRFATEPRPEPRRVAETVDA